MANDRAYLDRLGETVSELVAVYRSIGEASALVNSAWTARDALIHVVFWHESFARNVHDLARGIKPTPLKGTYAELGRRASAEAQDLSIAELLDRMTSAQNIIERSVHHPLVTSIPYKVGSRPYGANEHLAVVNEHVRGHLNQVRLAYAAPESPVT